MGAPGAGKSSVGRRLARHWDVPFQDSDRLVEARLGQSVAEIFIDQGESVFRQHERDVIEEALVDLDGVLALGGGAVLNDAPRVRLADESCVWLRVGVSEAARRVGLNARRPLLMGNVRGTLISLLDQRTPLYEEVATWTVDTVGRSIDDVVHDIVDQVGVVA